MNVLKFSLLAVFAFALVADAPGQFGKAKDQKGGKMMASATVLTDPLEPADLVAKLKPAGAQKLEMDKLFKEFDGKLKDIAGKATAQPAAGAAKSKFKGKGGKGATANPSVSAAIELRQTYEEKFEAMLTEPQKKVLEDFRVKQGEALLSGAKK